MKRRDFLVNSMIAGAAFAAGNVSAQSKSGKNEIAIFTKHFSI